MVGLYCASFAQVPNRITLDIDDSFDAVHGGQQLRLWGAHHDDDGVQPIVVFDGAGRFVTAVLRPARRPRGHKIAAHLRRLIREIRSHWPRVEILLRGDGHSCAPEVLDLCRACGVNVILGLPSTKVLRRHVLTLEASTTARVEHLLRPRPGRDPHQGLEGPSRRRPHLPHTSATANQLRLFLHAGADWLIWTLRAALPKRSPWRRARFDTLRLGS